MILLFQLLVARSACHTRRPAQLFSLPSYANCAPDARAKAKLFSRSEKIFKEKQNLLLWVIEKHFQQ
jgi:hypothetical protein